MRLHEIVRTDEIRLIPPDSFRDPNWATKQDVYRNRKTNQLPEWMKQIGTIGGHRIVTSDRDDGEILYVWGDTHPVGYLRLEGMRQTATVKAIKRFVEKVWRKVFTSLFFQTSIRY